MPTLTSRLMQRGPSLSGRLGELHDHLLSTVPAIDRIACALYDPDEDKLKTFVSSTRQGEPLTAHEYRLSDSVSLSEIARTGNLRVLDDISSVVDTTNPHSVWLREQGYQSSYTVPIYDQNRLLGLVFFDSRQLAAFTTVVQRDLALYCSLISMSISNEVAAVNTVIETTRVARELTGVRDFETGMHLERMARYARLIARHVAEPLQLSDEFVEHIYLFAPLHDIGKIAIPDRILLKPGRLEPDERAIMETHVAKGLEIIERIIGKGGMVNLPDAEVLRNIVMCHHEYLDGSGYPWGLKAEAVPIEARIVTVADIYDALTTPRSYKRPWTHQEAVAELLNMVHRGKLDPRCVEAMVVQSEEVLHIQRRYLDQDDLPQDSTF